MTRSTRNTRPLTKYGLAVLTAAVFLTGCGTAEPKDGSAAEAPASPTPQTTATATATAGATRDSVEADIVAAIRKAGIDPAAGKSTPVRGGAKRPDMFDWLAVLKTPEAEPYLTAARAELERLGWQRVPTKSGVVRHLKGDWSLLSSSLGSEALPSLPEGTSTLSFVATLRTGSVEGGESDG